MINENITIPYQNGELVFFLNEKNEAVLWDYFGDAKILYLPSNITYADENGSDLSYTVASNIPDLSFSSCKSIEILVCGYETHFQFGNFVFLHCDKLKTIVLLSLHNEEQTHITLKEFSLTSENYMPKELKKFKLFLGDAEDFSHYHDLYLPDPPEADLHKDSYAFASYLEYTFLFYDWLKDNLPRLIVEDNVDPKLFLKFICKYGQYDHFNGKNYMYFDWQFDRDTPTITKCIPTYDKEKWLYSNSTKQHSEYITWVKEVLKYFSILPNSE